MHALANGWTGSLDVIMSWAWMHWPMSGLVAWTLSWFANADLSDGASGANEGDGAYY